MANLIYFEQIKLLLHAEIANIMIVIIYYSPVKAQF